jgi:hypothetical protein
MILVSLFYCTEQICLFYLVSKIAGILSIENNNVALSFSSLFLENYAPVAIRRKKKSTQTLSFYLFMLVNVALEYADLIEKEGLRCECWCG